MENVKNITSSNSSIAKFQILSHQQLAEQVKKLPPLKPVWGGINEGSFGMIVGPSKSGKTTFCENLALSLVIGKASFWGRKLYTGKPVKVAFISFEENCRPRFDRSVKQLKALNSREKEIVSKNYFQPDCNFPQMLQNDGDWKLLEKTIKTSKAKIVFIDSLTRLYSGAIEESSVAQKLTVKLRGLSRDLGITIISIHHTTKNYGKPITIDSIAGSRVVMQEADFAIGINKLPNGNRYLKEIFYRYKEQSDIKVLPFKINEMLWLEHTGWTNEYELFNSLDGRVTDNGKIDQLVDFFKSKKDDEVITTKSLAKKFVNTKVFSKPTLHAYLKDLEKAGIITKEEKGIYKLNNRKEASDEA